MEHIQKEVEVTFFNQHSKKEMVVSNCNIQAITTVLSSLTQTEQENLIGVKILSTISMDENSWKEWTDPSPVFLTPKPRFIHK